MATSVSHAMRRYPATPPDSKYTNFTPIASEDSSIPQHQWSPTGRSEANVGGSALSRSMRYAEPWLYGSVRAAPGGLVLAYPAPAIVLCACTDYTTGTAKSKKGPVQCKKCKGTRLPLAQGGTVRAKYGTVRGYPTSSPALTTVRAGTVRVSSSSRPSILPAVDPYDLMRRSRLSCPDNTGSQFRARSISPSKPRSQKSTKIRPRSPSPLGLAVSRKSILECSVNPYELMATNGEKKEQNNIAVNGQKIRVKPDTDYEDVEVQVKKQSTSQIPVKLGHKSRNTRRSIERETVSNRNDTNKFKSILKKPSATFNDTDIGSTVVETTIKLPGYKSGSHFYLPMPNANRKKVQFLVENELANQSISNDRKEVEEQEIHVRQDEVRYEDLTNGKEHDESESPVTDDEEDYDEPCRLKRSRSLSERLNQSTSVVTFHDTMALRSRTRPTLSDSSTAFFDSITDLQRLDGVGPARPRPREPPPPPPPPSFGQEVTAERPATPPPRSCTESESGYEVTTLRETVKESGSNLLPLKDHEVKDNKTNNKQRNYSKKSANVAKKSLPTKQVDKLESPKQKNQHKPEQEYTKTQTNKADYTRPKDKRENLNVTENIAKEFRTVSENILDISPPESPPPVVPPRKRSNSRTPNNQISTKTLSDSVNEKVADNHSVSRIEGTDSKSTKNIIKKDEIIPKITVEIPEVKKPEETKIENKEINKTASVLEKTSPISEKYPTINYQSVRIETNDPIYEDLNKIENISISSPIFVNKREHTPQTIKIEPTKTIVQISSPPIQIIPSTVHRLQIRNECPEPINFQSVSITESPQRKTSIMINGDDCYSTVNVNDDVPIYQSSVVVNDCESSKIEINSPGTRSSVYITGGFQSNTSTLVSPSTNTEDVSKKTLVIFDNNSSSTNTPSPSISSGNSTPETIGKTFVLLQPENKKLEKSQIEHKNELNNKLKQPEMKDVALNKPSSEELQRLLKDPVEAVKRNLIPHVCGKADVERKPKSKKLISSNTLVARLLEDPFLGSLAEGLETDTVAKLIEDSLLKLRNQENSPEDDKDISSENESCPPYELMEVGSDCYSNHSNRSSVTEEELSTRSKFYQLLADSSLTEVEEHHYECIRPNVDPIYEEIEIPPPLPSNPPPNNIVDDLQIDKQFTTRSIFEGASKYDILSYLVDAKERGIVPEESYTYNFNNSGEVIVEEEEETKDRRSVFSSRVSHMSTVSDSSEDSSLVITAEKNGPQKSAEVERNDSGVGSETSKCSRSRYLNQPEPSISCEDCEMSLDPAPEDGPLICRKCSKKRSERKEIITEIVETEEKYSRDLQIILEEFYQPMLVAGLLTPEQLSAIFLNVEELLENSQALAERLRDTLEIAIEQGDEDLLTVNIGKIILEAAPMLHGFESYCVRQGAASLLLASLEKDKELLRIFLRVSQMENTMLRRMNLNSFLMVPVQRVTKYPLLLARLYKVTPVHHSSREQLREAQHKIELHLNHMNSETRDVPSKLWRRISSGSGRRSSSEMDLVNIKLRKIAVDVLEWNHDEARFALEGRLLFTQPTDNNWRKGRTIKLSPVNAMLVTNGKPGTTTRPDRTTEDGALAFPRQTGIREAALLLVRDKGGRYSLLREPLYLDRCVIATDPAWQSYFEVQELLGKDTFIFKAEDPETTRTWYRQLQYHAQGMGAWRKRRNALANIMINGMGSRS